MEVVVVIRSFEQGDIVVLLLLGVMWTIGVLTGMGHKREYVGLSILELRWKGIKPSF